MNLNDHGAACRCLLRLRENQGEPGVSDNAFIARYLPRYPDWAARPGATDLARMLELAKDMGVARGAEVFRGYDGVLTAHRAGHAIVVYTEFPPEQATPPRAAQRHVLLVTDMDDAAFALWCPYASGNSEVLPRAARTWWDAWRAIGVVLQPPEASG